MNVAIVVYSHYSRDARVRRYAESLARNGFGVDVICLNEVYLPQEDNNHSYKISSTPQAIWQSLVYP